MERLKALERDARARGLTIRVGIAPPPQLRDVDELWRFVDALEELGYDSIWLSDSATRAGLASVPALAAMAARTQRLKLGANVFVLPARNPVLLAKELATIDAISGGRLLPAGGLGVDEPVERGALAIGRGDRVPRLEEALEVIRLLWSGSPVSYEGRTCRLDGVRLQPRPTRPKLEFWLGGRARPALERIGRLADGWIASFVSPDELASGSDIIRAAARDAGRSIDEDHYGTTIFVAETGEDAAALTPRLHALRRDVPTAETVATGTAAARDLLERFVAAGASKFVVIPVARDPTAFLGTLRDEVVGLVES